MTVKRLRHLTQIGVEQMGDWADRLQDPDILRLENLDTDIRPPQSAISYTQAAVLADAANSYLPFFGLEETRKAAVELVERHSGRAYDWKTECLISAGGLSGLLNVLLATIEDGDEVLMTSPTYVGLINRVRLAGGVPRFVPLLPQKSGWRLDVPSLQGLASRRLKWALLMSPAMPTGAVFSPAEWEAVISFCRQNGCKLLYNAAMERILYDGLSLIHPASFEGMRDEVVTVGSASKEYRMIGWRVGWVVGPASIMADVARVSISNVVCQTGIAMGAVARAIRDQDDGILAATQRWQARRDVILEELAAYPLIKPQGGWSLLLDVSALGLDAQTAAQGLLMQGKVATTPMVNWGAADADKYIRLVFSNEPIERLIGLKARFDRALR